MSEKGSVVSGCRQLSATSQAPIQTCSYERFSQNVWRPASVCPAIKAGLSEEVAKSE